jgi:BolA protein
MQSRLQRIRAALTDALAPVELDVVDDSAEHAGHAGSSLAGETHFTIRVVSLAFVGRTRVARYRAVHDILQPEFARGLHALSLVLKAPGES